MASIPSLRTLCLARNKFKEIHSEELRPDSFLMLEELDFSFNCVSQ